MTLNGSLHLSKPIQHTQASNLPGVRHRPRHQLLLELNFSFGFARRVQVQSAWVAAGMRAAIPQRGERVGPETAHSQAQRRVAGLPSSSPPQLWAAGPGQAGGAAGTSEKGRTAQNPGQRVRCTSVRERRRP